MKTGAPDAPVPPLARGSPARYGVAAKRGTPWQSARNNQLRYEYAFLYFAGPSVQSVIEDQASGSTKQKELAQETVKRYLIPVPPLAEQRRIAERVSELMPLVGEYGKLEDEREALDASLPERLRKATVIPVDVDELDITDREATINYIRRHQPDTVINCAAFTNVDGCETARDAAFKVNAIGPRNLALACEKVNARLIHISTDYVFPGTANGGVALDECAVPAPISAYGQTKLLGEQYVERFCRRHFIVRTAWLYSSYGKNFVKTMIRLGRTHDKITVVNDQLGNPTNAVDLAYHILKLAVSHDYGIYHCTGNGICSWYDFACAIMQGAGLSCKVEPVTSAEYAAANPASASRPAWSALENRMLRCTVGDEMRDWQDALKDFFANWNGEL